MTRFSLRLGAKLLLMGLIAVSFLVEMLPKLTLRNLANLMTLHALIANKENTSQHIRLHQALAWLDTAQQIDNANWRLDMWHASLMSSLGMYSEAEQSELQAYVKSMSDVCSTTRLFISTALSAPTQNLPRTHLFGENSLWLYTQANHKSGNFSYESGPNAQKCIGVVKAHFEPLSNRYTELALIATVEPGQRYELNAKVLAHDLVHTRFGIQSSWSGVLIENSPNWQSVFYEFQTRPDQFTEIIHFVIDGGTSDGQIKIFDVTLKKIEIP